MRATKTPLLSLLFLILSTSVSGGHGKTILENETPSHGLETDEVLGAEEEQVPGPVLPDGDMPGMSMMSVTNDTMPQHDPDPTEEGFKAIEQQLGKLHRQVLSMKTAQPAAFAGVTYDRIHRGIDCSDLKEDNIGVYTMWRGDSSDPYDIMCQKDLDGAWTIIQRRVDDTVNFTRDWTEYVNGFGELGFETNFWFGLENMYQLTSRRNYILRVELTDFDGNYAYADYDKFRVLDADLDYKLLISDFSGGNAGDSLTWHNNTKFTTHDRDNDAWSGGNCGVNYKAGWWYQSCHWSNLNGLYYNYKTSTWWGMRWNTWGNKKVSKRVTMKIKPTY